MFRTIIFLSDCVSPVKICLVQVYIDASLSIFVKTLRLKTDKHIVRTGAKIRTQSAVKKILLGVNINKQTTTVQIIKTLRSDNEHK